MTTTPGLAAALLGCQRDPELQGVARTEYNPDGGYAYVATDKMIAQVRPVLLRHALVVRRRSLKIEDAGKKTVSTFEVTHVPSGEVATDEFDFAIHFSDVRDGDKCVAASATTAWREWLRDLLMLPRSDEAEMDKRPGRPATSSEAASGARPGAQPPVAGSTRPPVARRPVDVFDRNNQLHATAAELVFDDYNMTPKRRLWFLDVFLPGKPLAQFDRLIRAEIEAFKQRPGGNVSPFPLRRRSDSPRRTDA